MDGANPLSGVILSESLRLCLATQTLLSALLTQGKCLKCPGRLLNSGLSLHWNTIQSANFAVSVEMEGFPGGSAGKEPACKGDTWVPSLGWEDPLEKEMAPL